MPIGVFINALSIVLGGLIGLVVEDRLDLDFKENLNMVFGVCAMGMGISSVMLMKNMPAVIFAVVIGTALGLALHLGDRIRQGAGMMQRAASLVIKKKNTSISEEEFMATLVTVIVLFCASGTGIYGSMVAGMTGDHSILIAKSVLDLFTALIFACMLGGVVSMIAIPQMIIFLALFFGAAGNGISHDEGEAVSDGRYDPGYGAGIPGKLDLEYLHSPAGQLTCDNSVNSLTSIPIFSKISVCVKRICMTAASATCEQQPCGAFPAE